MPSWGPWDLLQLPEGAVGAQGTGNGRAPLLADGVLPQAGERHRAGEDISCTPTAPSLRLRTFIATGSLSDLHPQQHLHLRSLGTIQLSASMPPVLCPSLPSLLPPLHCQTWLKRLCPKGTMERRCSQPDEGQKLLSASQSTCGNNRAQLSSYILCPGSSFWPGWLEGLSLT